MEGTIHIDTAMSNISVAYSNMAFVARRVYLPVPVDHKSNKYYVRGKENFRKRDDRRTGGTEAKKSRLTISNNPYSCEGHALKDAVPREDTNNQDPSLDLLTDTTLQLTEQVSLVEEANLVTQLTTDMTGSSVADIVGSPWNNNANDPIARIRTEKETIAKRCGKMPNVMVFSQPVFTSIRQNTKVTGLITGAPDVTRALVTAAQIAQLCELDEVIVASSVYDTANEGQTFNGDWVWGARALLFYRPPAPGLRTLSLGYTFTWRGALASVAGEQQAMGVDGIGDQFVRRYFWEPTIEDVVEVHKYYDQRTVDKACGTLFINCNG